MTANGDLELIHRALDDAATTVAGVDTTQADASTPCPSWTVADLMNHLLNDLTQFETSVSGGELDWSAPTPAVEPSDWTSTFGTRSAALVDAWGQANDTGALGMQLAELALHTWDLARATGQPTTVDDEVAQRGLDWMSGMLKPEHRGSEAEGKVFGVEVAAPSGASPIERLVAFSGRPLA